MVTRPFKVHDLAQLVILSGPYKEMEKNVLQSEDFKEDWSTVSAWNEKISYSDGITYAHAYSFLSSG